MELAWQNPKENLLSKDSTFRSHRQILAIEGEGVQVCAKASL